MMKRTLLFLVTLVFVAASQAQLENTTWGLVISGFQGSVVHFDDAGFVNMESSPGIFVPISNYVIYSNQITITESQGASWFGCPEAGIYTFVIQGDILTFTLVQDDCAFRVQSMTLPTWTSLSTGIHANSSSDLSIYPNPSQGELYVEHSEPGTSTIRVIDMSGRMVLATRTSLERTHVDLSMLTRGIYLVEVNTPSGKAVQRVVLN